MAVEKSNKFKILFHSASRDFTGLWTVSISIKDKRYSYIVSPTGYEKFSNLYKKGFYGKALAILKGFNIKIEDGVIYLERGDIKNDNL